MMRPMCQVSLSWNQQDMDPSRSQIFVPANEAGRLSITNLFEEFNGSKNPRWYVFRQNYGWLLLLCAAKAWISSSHFVWGQGSGNRSNRDSVQVATGNSPLRCSSMCILTRQRPSMLNFVLELEKLRPTWDFSLIICKVISRFLFPLYSILNSKFF